MAAAVLTLPERIDQAAVRVLLAELARQQASSPDSLVIEGRSPSFCTGLHFGDVLEPGADLASLRAKLVGFAELLASIALFPRPTLAVVDGPALGGGLGLASACDLVLASTRARFGLPEALFGFVPAVIRPALLTRLSTQRLRLLLFTCHARPARDALALGLVDELVAETELASARARCLRALRRANGAAVRACRRWEADELKAALAAGVGETAAALAEPRIRAALRAFESEDSLPWSAQ